MIAISQFQALILTVLVGCLLGGNVFGFSATSVVSNNMNRRTTIHNKQQASDTTLFATATASSDAITTLTEETTWDLRFLLQSIPTENDKRVDQIFSAKVQFVEEEGYEPPQGDVKQIAMVRSDNEEDGDESSQSEQPRFQIVKSRWLLSEDPTDRKDGLWVWGLFKEPLYPFMLLQLETSRIPLPGDDNDAIKPLTLYAQLNHQREKDIGVILSGGDLNIKEAETFNADPFGAATVTVYDDVSVGNLQIQPSVSK